jgi:hypothetical protein
LKEKIDEGSTMTSIDDITGVSCAQITDFLHERHIPYFLLPEYEPVTDPAKELVEIPGSYQIMTSYKAEDDLIKKYGVPGSFENFDEDGDINRIAVYHAIVPSPDKSQRRIDQFTTIIFVDMEKQLLLGQPPKHIMAEYMARQTHR